MYYPDQTNISKLTVIRRECRLPEDAIGKVLVTVGAAVDIRDVVAQGVKPAKHHILDGAEFFGLSHKQHDQLNDLMLVEIGKPVREGQTIAGKDATRGRRLKSPIDGIIVQVAHGRIIIQELPELINVQAGLKGVVTSITPGKGVTIEAIGAQIQGVWGNGKNIIAAMRIEPEAGLASLFSERLAMDFVGTIVVTHKALTQTLIETAESQNIAGVIAPSMDASLYDRAMQSSMGILLTEGFGSMYMSSEVSNLLAEFKGKQITLDAYHPQRWDTSRPSVIINFRTDEQPPLANFMISLRRGMRVRINRLPHMGQQGRIIDLPKTPALLENGLSAKCAKVEIRGEIVDIPLVDIEVAGR